MRTAQNLIGKKFHYLTVKRPNPEKPYHWFCLCRCGQEKSIYVYSLLKNMTRSCGCIKSEKHSINFKDMTGETFNNWDVLKLDGPKHKGTYWWCRCKLCGSVKSIFGESIRTGMSKSCGCDRQGINIKHGQTGSPTYKVWLQMRRRCDDPKNVRYARYGGRGITYCERWKIYKNFLADMGEKPDGYQIERIDNDGNYEPNNCKWVPRKEQQRNTSRSHFVTFKGERLPIATWAERTGIPARVIFNRLGKLHWSVEATLTKHLRADRRRDLGERNR